MGGGEPVVGIGRLSGDDAQDRREGGQLGRRHLSVSFECESSRSEERADVRARPH